MKTHPEPEQLTAYLDGEVDAAERAQIEAHLRTCAECSATVTASRATIADLHELPSPTPSEQDSWALRAAVTRARKQPAKRYQRWVVAAGSVAALAIAIVVITQNTGTNKAAQHAVAGAQIPPALVSVENTDFNEQTASALVATDQTTALAPAAAGETSGSGTSAKAPSPIAQKDSTFGANAGRSPVPPSYLQKIQTCEQQIFNGDQRARQPQRYIVAAYKGTLAFFMLYSITSGSETKTELWVVRRADCYPLYIVPAR